MRSVFGRRLTYRELTGADVQEGLFHTSSANGEAKDALLN
jgi:hypothetical protein